MSRLAYLAAELIVVGYTDDEVRAEIRATRLAHGCTPTRHAVEAALDAAKVLILTGRSTPLPLHPTHPRPMEA